MILKTKINELDNFTKDEIEAAIEFLEIMDKETGNIEKMTTERILERLIDRRDLDKN